jgi:uncharacterized FlgJ-related protein
MAYDERIYNKAIADGMPPVLATLIVAQCRGESANYTSNVFLSCNNLNGYKWVGQSIATGPCLKSPEGDYYARYATIEDSVHELTQWIKRRQADGYFPQDLSTITTPEQYAKYLVADPNHHYYGTTIQAYTSMLAAQLKYIGNLATSTGGSAVLLILLALGIVYRKKLFG